MKRFLLALPTDTIYGLAGDANQEFAIDMLYEIKGRSQSVPLAICLGSVDQIGSFCEVDHLENALLRELLPGPVTIVLKRKDSDRLSPKLNPSFEKLGMEHEFDLRNSVSGIRVPQSEFVCNLSRQFGKPMALTSANRSGRSSSTSVEEFEELWDFCAIVFDGGMISQSKLGSTVVDLSEPKKFDIIRQGDGLASILSVMERFSIQNARIIESRTC